MLTMYILYEILLASYRFFVDSSFYMLLGIVFAGFIGAMLNRDFITRHLGGRGPLPVLKASLVGIPFPVCSCGVVPVAGEIRKKGGSQGAMLSFLVSTPESGVDSISLSLALLDPLMAIARPLSAFLSALTAGLSVEYFSKDVGYREENSQTSCTDSCHCDKSSVIGANEHEKSVGGGRLIAGFKYAVFDFWPELAPWFFIGILIAGLITVLMPDDLLNRNFNGISGMFMMLVCSIPLYICATASTPVAAAMIMKGVSPGVVLVFLLVGPATNAASISMLIGMLGRKTVLIYLLSIASSSIVCGLMLDFIYENSGIEASAFGGTYNEIFPDWLGVMSAVLLVCVYLFSIFLKHFDKKFIPR